MNFFIADVTVCIWYSDNFLTRGCRKSDLSSFQSSVPGLIMIHSPTDAVKNVSFSISEATVGLSLSIFR